MFAEVPLFPEQASTTAERVDTLFFFLCAVTGIMAVSIALLAAVLRRQVSPPRRGRPHPAYPRQQSPRMVLDHRADVRLPHHVPVGGEHLYVGSPAAAGCSGGVRRRQTVDVEDPAPRRPARDQRAAHPRRPAGQADADLGGRHSRLLRAGVPHQDRRDSRPLRPDLVPADQDRPLSPVLLAILRHQPRQHGRLRRRHGTRRNTRNGWTATPRDRWPCKAASCSSNCSASPATAPIRKPAPRCWRTCTAGPSTCATAAPSWPTTAICANRSCTPRPRSCRVGSRSCRPSRGRSTRRN